MEQCPLLVHLYLEVIGMDPSGHRFHIPSLETLHISISDSEDEEYLLGILDLFDTPALNKLIIDNARCDQFFELFNAASLPHASFPALTSFSCVNSGLCAFCADQNEPFSQSIIFPPLPLFPALTSLTLINQCLTATFVGDILRPASLSWPLLNTVTLCPQEGTLDEVYGAVRDGIHSKRQRGHALPKFRLSAELFSLIQDREIDGGNFEMFDPTEIVSSLELSFDWNTIQVCSSRTTDDLFIES